MKFIIVFDNGKQQRQLVYIPDEHSFDMEPIEGNTDVDLIVNTITLSVKDNKVIQLWGFCGLNNSITTYANPPVYKAGSLIVKHNRPHGFSYAINADELPVYVNLQTGWVCIGNPNALGSAVEFINNCVAVINPVQNLVSLWLKPNQLPPFN